MKKNIIVGIVSALCAFFLTFILKGNRLSYEISIYEIIDLILSFIGNIILVVLLFIITQSMSKKSKILSKIEEILQEIEIYMKKNYFIELDKYESLNELKNKFKYVGNKIDILEKLSKNEKGIIKNIVYIKKEFEKYEEDVSDNMDQNIEYYISSPKRSSKLYEHIKNIENKIDEIICDIYTK